jgi:hypothetical protein
MPRAPWLMTQTWHDLLFAHWPVDVSEVRRAVPAALDLDLFDGEAWVGVVPFYMTNVSCGRVPRCRGFQRLPNSTSVPMSACAIGRCVLLQPRCRPLVGGCGRSGVPQFALLPRRDGGGAGSRACAVREQPARRRNLRRSRRSTKRRARRSARHLDQSSTSSRSDTVSTITVIAAIRTGWKFTTRRGRCRLPAPPSR